MEEKVKNYKHGISGYNNRGCRCPVCRSAKSTYLKTPVAIANAKKSDFKWRSSAGGKEYAARYEAIRTVSPERIMKKSAANANRYADPEIKSKILINRKVYLNTPKYRFKVYKSSAKYRGWSFDLTFDQFVSFWNKPCYYCGCAIDSIGLDRVDSNIGYVIGNVVPCCPVHNRMKSDMSKEKFLQSCRDVVNNFPIGGGL